MKNNLDNKDVAKALRKSVRVNVINELSLDKIVVDTINVYKDVLIN
jgi:hypothetical protein